MLKWNFKKKKLDNYRNIIRQNILLLKNLQQEKF